VVQGFPQAYRVHQGCTGPVFTVEPVQLITGKHEGGYLESPAVAYLPVVEADAGQIAAAGEQVGSQEDIRGLVVLDVDHLLG